MIYIYIEDDIDINVRLRCAKGEIVLLGPDLKKVSNEIEDIHKSYRLNVLRGQMSGIRGRRYVWEARRSGVNGGG